MPVGWRNSAPDRQTAERLERQGIRKNRWKLVCNWWIADQFLRLPGPFRLRPLISGTLLAVSDPLSCGFVRKLLFWPAQSETSAYGLVTLLPENGGEQRKMSRIRTMCCSTLRHRSSSLTLSDVGKCFRLFFNARHVRCGELLRQVSHPADPVCRGKSPNTTDRSRPKSLRLHSVLLSDLTLQVDSGTGKGFNDG